MTPESQVLLASFWSWTSGVLSVLLLGLVLPAALGFLVGASPLVISRHDLRPVGPMLLLAAVSAGTGVFTLLQVRTGAPTQDFWLVLSAEISVIAFVTSAGGFLRVALRRRRQDLDSLRAVQAFTPNSVVVPEGAEPGARARLSAFEAEYYVAEWMRALGAHDSEVTPSRRDGGVDVRSGHYVAQVKHRPEDFVSVDVVRALGGVANAEGRTGLVFTSGRFSSDALAFAGRTGIALFIFRPAEGRLVAANALAQRFRQNGLSKGVSASVDTEAFAPDAPVRV